MKQKHISSFLIGTAAAAAVAGLLPGCASHRPTVVTTTPQGNTLAPDSAGQVDIDLTFHVPARYLSRRARLIITPQLVQDDTVRDEYLPVVLDASIYGKKTRRKEVLEGYEDPYKAQRQPAGRGDSLHVPYRQTVGLPDGVDAARLRAVISEDGCGECSGVDTIDLASVATPVTLMEEVKESFDLAWMEPKFVVRPKIREGRGVARLQFVINKYDIRPELGNNRAELEHMEADLGPVLRDSLATLTSLDIYGMASADGSFGFNTTLAQNRAKSARRWLVERLGIRPEVERLITSGSRPEGWWPVYEAMRQDGHPDSLAVKRILETYTEGNDDVQEYHIRRLRCWPDIRAKYLQKDRKVEYVYTYTLRSFTDDAEMLRLYETRPDAFNEDELLRVAYLVRDDEDKMMEVYRTLQHFFPQNEVAANNLAVLYLRRGDTEKARASLELLERHSPETLNTLAASYVWKGDYERAIELLQRIDLPEARYNLGLLMAARRDLPRAYELLKPYKDLNSAICALSVNRNEEADGIMRGLPEVKTPVAEYVRALIAARLDRPDELMRHLKPACTDPKLRKRAKDEPDFDPYRELLTVND